MPGTISESDAQYALDLVKAICTQVGPGFPGSPQERKRAAMIKKELVLHLGAGNVVEEEFTLAPGAFLSAYPLSAIFTLVAAFLNITMGQFAGISTWITTLIALTFSLLSVILVVFEFVLGFEFVDPIFKKRPSVNVVGRLRRPGVINVKRLLILSGHHDSAWENTWFGFLGTMMRTPLVSRQGSDRENPWYLYLGASFYAVSGLWFIGLIALLVANTIQMTGILISNASLAQVGTLGWAPLVFLIGPSIIFGMFFNRGKKNGGTVPGAADNLSGSALVAAMCRFLVKNPLYIPADTEIRFVSFGSEEAGLRGSRRYVQRHLSELKSLDGRLLNFETVADPEITILTSDGSGYVKNSPELIISLTSAAERAGVPYQVKPASSGVANDSAPFSKAGLKAATLLPFKMPQQMIAFYHQKRDTPEILSTEPLLNVLKLTLEWLRLCGE